MRPSKLRMFALTLLGGVAMALLYVGPPLIGVAILSSIGITVGWFWLVLGAAAVVCWAALFTLALREHAEQIGRSS